MSMNSPLHTQHAELGARFVDFGGWDMPVQYESVLAEHKAVREDVGVFDVSHLGRLGVSGKGATEALSGLLTNDVAAFEPGRTHYTMMLNPDGGIIDDIVIWRWDTDDYWVMPNAANSATVMAAIEAGGPGLSVTDLRATTVLLAVQGPNAPALLEKVVGEAPKRFRCMETNGIRLAGTGYTGERGGEVCLTIEQAPEVFAAFLDGGATPCGLGSRDTLRLEAGLGLWGSDIDETTTPLEAGLGFAVNWDHDFVGKSALEQQRAQGVGRKLCGVIVEGRGIPRHGYAVRSGDSVGEVTSGNISPVLDTGIALAYMSPPVETGAPAEIEIRNKWVPGKVHKPPFHK